MESTKNELSSLRDQYHKLIESCSLNSKSALDLAARCRELIFHIHQRIEYCEKRRSQMVVIALSLLAAAVALFAATFLEAMGSGLLVSLVRLTGLLLFLTAAITLALYGLQTNFNYPFIEITKTWRWFYHYSVSKEYKPPFFPFERANEREKMQKIHLKDLLTSASGPYSESYTYDEIGNITSKNGVSYTYGSQPHAVTAVGETSYNYDDNGNMTDRGSQDITWDVENRIIEVDDGENTSTFVYDGNGNRVKKTEGGETILYVNKYYEKNLTTGEVTTYYYHGGKLVAMCQDTELKYVHQDHLTSTSVMTDNSGNELGTVKYFPFGATRSGSVPTDKKFTGKRLDETGLYYYGARYYDANIGRFISADTMITDFTNPQTLNRYSYCLNNPLKYTDPSGHGIFDDIVEKAKKIIKSAGDAFKTGYNAAKSWVSSTYQSAASNVQSTYQGFTSTMSNAGNSAIDALVNFGKSLVEGAAAKCEPSLQANKAAGDSGVGGSNPVYDSVSSAINNTITPALNSTGAGITSVYVKNGYTGVNFAEGGWGVAAMKLLGFYVDEPAALTLANPAYGLGLFPPPASSLVLVRNELEDPRTRSHEEGHVVENLTLGGPVYSSMYGLGMLLYEHSENPFEVLANKYASP
jgi:RHS repeat-associated protein